MKPFLFALGLSVLLYAIGSPIILSLVSLPSILLWGIALIPVWWVSYKEIKNFANSRLTRTLKVLDNQIQKNETFLEKKWPSQIDVKRDDLDRLAQKATKYIEAIDFALKKAHQPKSWRDHPWISDKALRVAKLGKILRLEDQKRQIESKITLLVESVPQQIEALIFQIKPDFRNPTDFVPELEPGKLDKLTDFVNHYGSEQTKKDFAKNTNLINLFVHSLDLKDLQQAKFIYKKPKPSPVDAPWGGYRRIDAQFRGWHHLINGWMVKGEKKEALKRVLLLLEGKLILTPEVLAKDCEILENDHVSNLVRSHLFLLLEKSENIKLLKVTDQEKIEGWYQSHKADIVKAQYCMEAIFREPSRPFPDLPELANYFHLLDHAILISSIQSEYNFSHLIRNYFDHYEGEHPWAHIFLRFVPEDSPERIQYTQKAQTKRLEWFINQADKLQPSSIHQEEVSLFNDRHVDPQIASNPCELIGKTIKKHPLYTAPYSPAFQNFLDLFSKHAFCNNEVKTEYLQAHKVGASLG